MYCIQIYQTYEIASDDKTKNLQCVLEAIVQLHYSRLVATAIAVVWSTEYCHHITFVAPIVTLIGKTTTNDLLKEVLVCMLTLQLVNTTVTRC